MMISSFRDILLQQADYVHSLTCFEEKEEEEKRFVGGCFVENSMGPLAFFLPARGKQHHIETIFDPWFSEVNNGNDAWLEYNDHSELDFEKNPELNGEEGEYENDDPWSEEEQIRASWDSWWLWHHHQYHQSLLLNWWWDHHYHHCWSSSSLPRPFYDEPQPSEEASESAD